MFEIHDVYVVLHAAIAVLAAIVAVVAWRHRAARGAVSVAVLMLGVVIWSGAYAAMWYVHPFALQAFWEKVTSLGSWMVPVGYLTLAFDTAGMHRWRAPGRVAAIAITSFVLNNLEWLNPGGLYSLRYVSRAVGAYTSFAPVPGPLYWVFVAYAYVLIAAAAVILSRVAWRASGADRTEAAIFLAGGMIPAAASVVTQSGLITLDIDLAPLAFLATGALWLSAILRGILLEVVPLARGALVEQMLDGVIVVDSDDCVLDANPSALRMLDARSEEALGMSAERLLGGVEGATAVLRQTGPRRVVLTMGPNGAARHVELGVTPLVIGRGMQPARLVTLHDVTEEMRVSERLRLTRKVFDTANEGIVVALADGDERVIDVNDAFSRLTGRLRQDVIGRPLADLESDRHPREFYEAMRAGLFATGEWQGEVWQARADGTVFPSWLSLSLAEDDDEHKRHIVSVFTDITEIREAQELREASDLKSRFLANMSHELRTPLNSIIGFTGVIEQGLAGPLTGEQHTQLGMIRRSGMQLLRLVNDMLDVERMEAGRTHVTLERFDVCQVVRRVASDHAVRTQEKGIRLRVALLPEPLEIVSDRSKVEEILTRILDNAVKFTESGEVGIGCAAGDGGVSVVVSDTGIGILPKDVCRIADRFTQVDGVDGMKPSGTGLGLSIARLLLEALGGRLEIESEPGAGSRFRVWLPSGR